jgi:hypothetical protein
MKRLRLAALAVAGLSPADRNWILGRIPAQAKTLLNRELATLPRAVSLSHYRQLRSEVVGAASTAPRPVPVPVMDDHIQDLAQKLDGMSATAIVKLLSEAPSWFAAAVMDVHPWRWKAQVRRELPNLHRESRGTSRPVAPAAIRAMLSALIKLHDESASQPAEGD